MSDSEINDPEKYSKKTINNYDGFSRIYFNGNDKKKRTNLVNSRFFYASGMLKKNREIQQGGLISLGLGEKESHHAANARVLLLIK